MREETGRKEEGIKTTIIFSIIPQNRHVSYFTLSTQALQSDLPLIIAGRESDPVSNPFSGSSLQLANRLLSVISYFLVSFALVKV